MKIIAEHLVLDNRVVRRVCIVDGKDNNYYHLSMPNGKHNNYYYLSMPDGFKQITYDRFNEMENNLGGIANTVVENKTTVLDWFNKLETKISVRLLNTLLKMNKEEKWQYIEDIDAADIRRVRGAGLHTYNEFKILVKNGIISRIL